MEGEIYYSSIGQKLHKGTLTYVKTIFKDPSF